MHARRCATSRSAPLRDAPVISAMCRLAQQYPRYGYRRIRIFLKREGHEMSWQRAHRLWQSPGCSCPRAGRGGALPASRPRPLPPTGPNSVWAYDFVFDACANGQQIKCLTVIDEFTRECLAIDVAGSIRSKRVIEVLTRLISERGAPRHPALRQRPGVRQPGDPEWIVAATDRNGPHRSRQALAERHRRELQRPSLRDECLSLEWFRSRLEARVIIEQWRRHYNEVRPHSSLDYRTPVEFRQHHASLQPGATFK